MVRGQESPDGTTRWSQNGYLYRKIDGRWELEHRLIMERKLGRSLHSGERVVFLDKDRENLDPSNLDVTEMNGNKNKKRIRYLEYRIKMMAQELQELYKEEKLSLDFESKIAQLFAPTNNSGLDEMELKSNR